MDEILTQIELDTWTAAFGSRAPWRGSVATEVVAWSAAGAVFALRGVGDGPTREQGAAMFVAVQRMNERAKNQLTPAASSARGNGEPVPLLVDGEVSMGRAPRSFRLYQFEGEPLVQMGDRLDYADCAFRLNGVPLKLKSRDT